jgi:hypothetical protein
MAESSLSEASSVRTSTIEVLSSTHGRERRAERLITKINLQAAVKHGVKELAPPLNGRGDFRLKFTFADVVYITDLSGTKEITSYAIPGAGIDIEMVPITAEMLEKHTNASKKANSDKASWTSHSVLVVDQSGSMRKTVEGGATRSDAVWVNLAVDFVAKQLESGEALDSDIVSVLAMQNGSSVLIDKVPHDWVLYNNIIKLLRKEVPLGPGNYLPTLDAAEQLLLDNTYGSCALLLLFLSDGAPSDEVASQSSEYREQYLEEKFRNTNRFLNNGLAIQFRASLIKQRMGKLASRFGRRLTVGTIAFGGQDQDFAVLESMAETVRDYNAIGMFQFPDLSAASLGVAISSLTSSLTRTRTELTELKDGTTQAKTVRDVRREAMSIAGKVPPPSDEGWLVYHRETLMKPMRDGSTKLQVGRYEADGRWVGLDFAQGTRTAGVAMRRSFFGEGSERLVRLFHELGPNKTFVGPMLVSKESRFVEDLGGDDALLYHKSFCRSQLKAKRLAEKFNAKLAALPGVDHTIPRITFLDCMLYAPVDTVKGRIGLLVEKMLDPTKYKKWNNNAGYVRGQEKNQGGGFQYESFAEVLDEIPKPIEGAGFKLGAIAESDEEESNSEEDDESEEKRVAGVGAGADATRLQWEAADILQAFSHFTHQHTRRKMLVCDLQGVLDDNCTPPIFELTDPAIHYRSGSGRANVYGRTDKGERGILDFFKTHQCSELCRRINKKWRKRGHATATGTKYNAKTAGMQNPD